MKRVHFKFGKWGLTDVVYISHSGSDWNRKFRVEETRYWITEYINNGYEVVFKNN